MTLLGWLRTNWRIVLLVVMLLASAYFLFVPEAPIAGSAAEDVENTSAADRPTNLQYGIQLDGGAQITAPVVGYTAEDVPITDREDHDVTQQNEQEVRQAVAEAMDGVEEGDVRIYTAFDEFEEENVVEVRADGDPEEFAEGLQNAGYDYEADDVRKGVTETTRSRVVEVLDERLGQAGFGGGDVTQTRTGQETRVQVEAPGRDLGELQGLIEERGLVQQLMHYPNETDPENPNQEEVLRGEDITSVGTVQREEATGRPYVRVELTSEAAARMSEMMRESGFADNPGQCNVPEGAEPGPNEYCLLTVVDGDTVFTAGIRPDLAESFRDGTFDRDRSFRMTTNEFGDAQELRLNLEAGALPAEIDLDRADQLLVNPALAEGFRTNSLLTGVIAIFAVVLMVFLRYGDPRVAAPMSATALSEVVILLGFAAAIGWPLDLGIVAGFIAVIGTGVDDLIIIADEVMSEGEVQSHRVFDSRFKKAFWVIGAAAATTIIAMSPLAVLDLGDLRGFAIVTILGVLIGVSVTRPAYGNILRSLKTEGR